MDIDILDKLEEISKLYDDRLTRKILRKEPHITFGQFLKARDKYTEDAEKRRDIIDAGLIIVNIILGASVFLM